MVDFSNQLIYIYSAVGLILILLVYNLYLIYKTKKMIKQQIEYERGNSYYPN